MYFPFKGENGWAGAGSGEVFEVTKANQKDFALEPGWYWWPCYPGCLPDGDAVGPFKTSQQAVDDAQQKGPGHDLV